MHAPGLRHVCCTHHQAFQSLSVRNAGTKLNKNRASPGFFYAGELLSTDLFSRKRDLELQIR